MACPQLGLGEIVPRTVATRESLEGLTPEKAQPKPKPLGLGAQPSSLGRAKLVRNGAARSSHSETRCSCILFRVAKCLRHVRRRR